MLLNGGRSPTGARVIGRAAVHAMTHGNRLAPALDYPFKNLGAELPQGSAPEAEGWGLGFALSAGDTGRPSPALEASPVFGWAGLHSLPLLRESRGADGGCCLHTVPRFLGLLPRPL